MQIGTRVKVIDQPEIIGKIVEVNGNKVVIEDEDAETEDDRLEFKMSDLKEFNNKDGNLK